MKKMMVMASAMLFVSVNFASATPLTPETKLKLEVLRAAIDTWAPMCEGAMSLNRDCYQGDLIEYSGYRCATGDLERCNDIKQAQDVDGRFWRAHRLIGKTDSDSFSRDMFMGLMFYYTTTKDVASLKKWLDYLYSHHSKMCDDANDNRCTLMPSTWGMLGLQMEHQG